MRMHDIARFFFTTAPHEFMSHLLVAGPMAAISFTVGLNLKTIWLTTAALVALWAVCMLLLPFSVPTQRSHTDIMLYLSNTELAVTFILAFFALGLLAHVAMQTAVIR